MGRRAPVNAMNITALLAGLFSGIIASMGMGGGAVLLIYLTVFASVEQLAAQGINLIFFIPIGLLSLIIYTFKKQIEWRICLPIAAVGVLGAFAGIYISGVISGDMLGKIFGIFLCFLGLKEIFTKDKKRS
ncbi:MAG: sulfite exporter TauE/SafE family protein [Clostridia bacterium]|nr:sulfite exporter TauE/SafE family protein [Clostridia bacterium]